MSSQILCSKSPRAVSIQKLMTAQFAEAKQWWFWANILKLSVIIITTVSIVEQEQPEWIWILTALLTAAYVVLQWNTDALQGKAEAVRRKFDFQNGLGWEITEQEKAAMLIGASRAVKETAYGLEESPYYDSQEPVSLRRAVENLMQSAWYTSHQARVMSKWVFAVSTVIFVLAGVSMVVVLQSPPLLSWGPTIGRTIVTVLVFSLAMGYIHLGFRYRFLFRQAEKAVDRASILLELETIAEIPTIQLFHEYQIVCAAAPMIPDWLWNRNKRELNRLWHDHFKQ